MAVITSSPPLELSDELAATYLAELARSGRTKAAARATGVDRRLIWERRERDPEFRKAIARIKVRRVQDTGDELFWAIDGLAKLIGGYERVLDELINCTYGGIEDPPARPEVDPARLQAARARLRDAGAAWAAAVVAYEGIRVYDRDVVPEVA